LTRVSSSWRCFNGPLRTLSTSINFLFTDDTPALGVLTSLVYKKNSQEELVGCDVTVSLGVCLAQGVSVGCLNRPPALRASAPQPQACEHGSFQHHGQAAPSLLLCREADSAAIAAAARGHLHLHLHSMQQPSSHSFRDIANPVRPDSDLPANSFPQPR
jgi:hypothetical protein